ncbi:MAG: DUF4340 protein [Magnetococcales bacterium]|nr:DUF4340 protein [Magnetococcales bacterium]HIJ85079.1 DUF4340 domain-containing protein [Magnetococcales bacterium]
MEKTIRILAVVFVVQLVLAAILGLTGSGLGTQAPDTTFFSFKVTEIDDVTIHGEGRSLHLVKKDNRWILPDQKGFPAHSGQVQTLLESLGQLKHGLPVATTAAAQTRFKVADKEFERKIVLTQNGLAKAVLYTGTSPGLRQVHARLEGMETTHSVAFANHQASVKVDDWIDKTILAIPMEEIVSLDVAGLTVTPGEVPAQEKKDSGKAASKEEIVWQVNPLAQGESPNQAELVKLMRSIAHLSVDGLEEAGGETAAALEKPALELAVKRKDGSQVVYKVAKVEKKGAFLVKSSAREENFRIAGYVGEQFLKNSRKENLVISPMKEGDKKAPEGTEKKADALLEHRPPEMEPSAIVETPIEAVGDIIPGVLPPEKPEEGRSR